MQQFSKAATRTKSAHVGSSAWPLRSEFADDPEMGDLVRMFVDELPQRLGAMVSALAAGDGETVRRMAHQLRGAGAGYGFPTVGTAAGEVEMALAGRGGRVGEAELDAVRAKVEALVAMCRRAAA